MYNNPYLNTYNSQANIDRINNQMAELERIKQQLQHPPVQQQGPTNLTQNFQIAPTSQDVIRYAGSIEDVQRNMVIGDTPYFSKDMSIVWVKSLNGNIKTYELSEIIPKDSKDLQIEYLQAQIQELKKGMKKNESNANVDDAITESIEDEKSTDVSTISKSTKKSK